MPRLAVQGSRGLCDARVKIILLEEIAARGITEIVTAGEPDGACRIARDLCREEAIPLTLHFLNFRYLRGAFEHRSLAVLNDCDWVVFIHDGVSKGTANELKLAEKLGIPHSYHRLDRSAHGVAAGFDTEKGQPGSPDVLVVDPGTPDFADLINPGDFEIQK